MQLQRTKTALGTVWILAGGAVAATLNGLSVTGAALVVAVVVIPPLLMLALWHPPTPALSGETRAARR